MPTTKSPPPSVPAGLAERISSGGTSKQPLWAGPSAEGPLGGITQSMIQDFLRCRERFRIKYVLGLQPSERWDHRIGYGNMWHVCEEFHAMAPDHAAPRWLDELTGHAQEMLRQFPLQQQEIEKWYNVCRIQFPHYVAWWAGHPDVKNRTPLLSEHKFDVPYRLPSGRIVRLRGKWDSVDQVEETLIDGGAKKRTIKRNRIWLQENKAKGEVDVATLEHQLKFDLQTMLYLTALQSELNQEILDGFPKGELAGVRYNAIRRPLSGGKGTIQQRDATLGAKCTRKACQEKMETVGTGAPGCDKCGGKGRSGGKPAETADEYFARLSEIIGGAVGEEWGTNPDEHYFFCRINVEVRPEDIQTFRTQFLDPILEQLCDWWDWISKTSPNVWEGRSIHWRNPFGVYYSLDAGGTTEYDHYLETGSEVGLRRANELFPELKG